MKKIIFTLIPVFLTILSVNLRAGCFGYIANDQVNVCINQEITIELSKACVETWILTNIPENVEIISPPNKIDHENMIYDIKMTVKYTSKDVNMPIILQGVPLVKGGASYTYIIGANINECGDETQTFQAGSDASVVGYSTCGGSSSNSNFNNEEIEGKYLPASSCQTNYIGKGLIGGNMPTIPTGSIVKDAQLHLHPKTSSGANAAYVKMATSGWSESTVTYNTAPSVTDNNNYIAEIPTVPSNSVNQPLSVNITNMAEYWNKHPEKNHGLMIEMQDYNGSAKELTFHSSEASNSNYHPEISITYTSPFSKIQPVADSYVNNASYCGGNSSGTNYGEYTSFSAGYRSGTFCQNSYYSHSMMRFDLSHFSSAEEIESAILVLTPQSFTGDNASVLKQITSQWQENTVSWNTKPSTTTDGAITINTASDLSTEIKINVTDWVKSWVEEPWANKGFVIEPAPGTSGTRMMSFYSSDIEDPALKPRILLNSLKSGKSSDITVSMSSVGSSIEFKVSPTFSDGNIVAESNKPIQKIQVFTLEGKLVYQVSPQSETSKINLSGKSGTYIVSADIEGERLNARIIIQK